MSRESRRELILGDGAIRVFGDVGERLPSRGAWNDPTRWKRHYAGLPIAGDVLAESFLGDQYVIVDALVGRGDPETGDIESTDLSPEDWIAAMREDASTEVPAWLLQKWERSNGTLPVSQHLAPKLPYVLGGEFEIDNLFAAEAESDLVWRAQLAVQIRDLPDGAEVKLHVRWDD